MTRMPMMPTPISPETAALINKGLAILAIAAFLAAAATILPSFQPSPANASPVLIKADRIATTDPTCAEQNWPNFNPSCLKRVDTNSAVKQVRHVTTDKL